MVNYDVHHEFQNDFITTGLCSKTRLWQVFNALQTSIILYKAFNIRRNFYAFKTKTCYLKKRSYTTSR